MKKVLLIAILALCFVSASSKEVRKTLRTPYNDEFEIIYDISQNEAEVAIRFRGVVKSLSGGGGKEYKDPERLDFVFFDRDRAFQGISFNSREPIPFSTPTSLRYSNESKGYFFLKEYPEIVFKRTEVKDCDIVIPLFLSYYERKGKYRLLEEFPDFTISITAKKPVTTTVSSLVQVTTQEQVTVETGGGEDELVLLCTAIRNSLKRQKELPFDDILTSHIDELGRMQRQRTSTKDQKLINSTLDQIEAKRQELKDIEKEKEAEIRREAERKERQAAAELKAEQDAIRAEEEQKEKEREKRNIWMIVGGGLLAVLGFGGNQLIQHVRNSNTQKSMMEMQENLVKQAGGEAKRRAKSYVANTARQGVNKVRTAGRQAVQSQVSKTKTSIGAIGKSNKVNRKKGISI